MSNDERRKKIEYKFVNYEPSTITFYNQDKDVLLKEPTLLAFNTQTDSVVAVGEETQRVFESENIVIGSPFKNGAVADFSMAREMLRAFLRNATTHRKIFKTKIAVCIQKDMTPVESQALCELMLSIGAKNGGVLIMEESFENAMNGIPDSYKIIIEISAAKCAWNQK